MPSAKKYKRVRFTVSNSNNDGSAVDNNIRRRLRTNSAKQTDKTAAYLRHRRSQANGAVIHIKNRTEIEKPRWYGILVESKHRKPAPTR
jgi:hypothetical protein